MEGFYLEQAKTSHSVVAAKSPFGNAKLKVDDNFPAAFSLPP